MSRRRSLLSRRRNPRASRPVPHPLPPLFELFSDKKIGDAISRGVHYLIGHYDPATHLLESDPSLAAGANALSAYTLLQCNEAIVDPELNPTSPFMASVLEALKSQSYDVRFETYGRSLRANALSLADRAVDRSALVSDVTWLQNASRDGAYVTTQCREFRTT